MSNGFPGLRAVAVLSLAASLAMAAGCDPRNSASTPEQKLLPFAGIVAKDGGDAVGTDEAVEDATLTTQVREAILADPELQSQPIAVETQDAAVTLTGSVDSDALRERAIGLAGSVNGVVQVQDRLRVGS